MVCQKCSSDGILNSALGKQFYYCRTCKEEIQLEVVQRQVELSQEEIDRWFDPAQNPIANYDDDIGDLFDDVGV